MNILKYGYIALALFSGAITTSGSDSDRSYEKTINVDTITWEQLDPGLRKYYIKTVICGLENADAVKKIREKYQLKEENDMTV